MLESECSLGHQESTYGGCWDDFSSFDKQNNKKRFELSSYDICLPYVPPVTHSLSYLSVMGHCGSEYLRKLKSGCIKVT